MTDKHPWYERALTEIDTALKRGKTLLPWEDQELELIRKRISLDLGLTDEQQDDFRRIHARLHKMPLVNS